MGSLARCYTVHIRRHTLLELAVLRDLFTYCRARGFFAHSLSRMKENEIHQGYIKWLDMMGLMYGHERTDRRTSSVLGEPDFRIYEQGSILFQEVKVLGNKLSDAQVKRHLQLRVAGCRVDVCFSVEECVESCKRWLADIKRATGHHMLSTGHTGKPLDCVGVNGNKGKTDI